MFFSSEIVTSVPSRNSPFSSRRSYVSRSLVGLLEPDQPPVGLAEPAVLRDLLDQQVPAHGEVDERRRDVEHVRLLVDQRAHLAGAQVVGRRELDGRRCVGLAERHGLVLARRVAHHLVDLRAAVAPVAASPPDQSATTPPIAASAHHGGAAEGGRRGLERAAEGPALLEHRRRLGHGPLGQAHHDRDPAVRSRAPLCANRASVPSRDRPVTGKRRPLVPLEARHLRDVGGRMHA